jgi:hypothetical protein
VAAALEESGRRDESALSATIDAVTEGLRSRAPAASDRPEADLADSSVGALAAGPSGDKDEVPAPPTVTASRVEAESPAPGVRPMPEKKAFDDAMTKSTSRGVARRARKADSPSPVQAQAAFDQLKGKALKPADKKRKASGSLGRVEDLELASGYFEKQANEPRESSEQRIRGNVTPLSKRSARKEQSLLPETETSTGKGASTRILTFESELDPFEFSLLDSGHFVLYRKVWRSGQRFIQGVLINQRPFLEGIVGRAFSSSALVTTSKLAAAWDGDLLWAVGAASQRYVLTSAEDLAGALLHRERLSAPFSDLELVFTVAQLPAGPGARVVAWVAAVIAIVLCGGLALMYRLGARQLDLARQP